METRCSIFLSLLLICIGTSCNSGTDTNSVNNKNADYYKNKGYQVFEEYGFAIKAPCPLKDVSNTSNADFILNLGGIENPNSALNLAAYQLILIRLPIGRKNMSSHELSKMIDDRMNLMTASFSNVERVEVGYEGYSGYIGETEHNGYKQKGLVFYKNEYIFSLSVISNNNLENRFNQFSNNIKFISSQTKVLNNSNNSLNDKKEYSNTYYSIHYPDSWIINSENTQVTNQTSISLQIMAPESGSNFRPNVNIIVASRKYSQPVSQLVDATLRQNRQTVSSFNLITRNDNIIIGDCQGSYIEYKIPIKGYVLRSIQYTLKKSDNTVFVITGTMDNNKHSEQKTIINSIIESIKIK